MARFSLADLQTSTLLYATDSLDEMTEVVDSIVRDDGLEGLEGFSLSVIDAKATDTEVSRDEEILAALRTRRAGSPM